MTVKSLVHIKIIATVIALVFPAAHEWAMSCSSYTVPYVLAVMFDDTITKTVGLLIIGAYAIYMLAWIASPFLLRHGHSNVNAGGLVTTIVLNLCDMVCCILSFLESQDVSKGINILLSAFVVFAAVRTFKAL